MNKQRIPIPSEVAAQVLVASDRTCCKCEERGAPIQIHHIDEDPSNNNPDNLAVLCLKCHDETQVSGGFARRLSAEEVRRYRNQWIERISERRAAADALFVQKAAGISFAQNREGPSTDVESQAPKSSNPISRETALRYIDMLPDILAAAYKNSRPGWSGNTAQMVNATYDVIEVVKEMWLRLSRAFPQNHFGGNPAGKFLEDYMDQHYTLQYALAEPSGRGTGGTIVRVQVAGGILSDLEEMTVETVSAIRGLGDHVDSWNTWLDRWNVARGRNSVPGGQ